MPLKNNIYETLLSSADNTYDAIVVIKRMFGTGMKVYNCR